MCDMSQAVPSIVLKDLLGVDLLVAFRGVQYV